MRVSSLYLHLRVVEATRLVTAGRQVRCRPQNPILDIPRFFISQQRARGSTVLCGCVAAGFEELGNLSRQVSWCLRPEHVHQSDDDRLPGAFQASEDSHPAGERAHDRVRVESGHQEQQGGHHCCPAGEAERQDELREGRVRGPAAQSTCSVEQVSRANAC